MCVRTLTGLCLTYFYVPASFLTFLPHIAFPFSFQFSFPIHLTRLIFPFPNQHRIPVSILHRALSLLTSLLGPWAAVAYQHLASYWLYALTSCRTWRLRVEQITAANECYFLQGSEWEGPLRFFGSDRGSYIRYEVSSFHIINLLFIYKLSGISAWRRSFNHWNGRGPADFKPFGRFHMPLKQCRVEDTYQPRDTEMFARLGGSPLSSDVTPDFDLICLYRAYSSHCII